MAHPTHPLCNKDQEALIDRKFRHLDYQRKFGRDFVLSTDCYDGKDLADFTLVPCPHSTPGPDGSLARHTGCYIVAIDGLCQAEQGDFSEYLGIYWAKSSQHNYSKSKWDPDEPCFSKERAEVLACRWALMQPLAMKAAARKGMAQIVVKTSSEYVFKSMTESIFKWRRTGYKDDNGRVEENVDMFKTIEATVMQLDGWGIGVLFWHVPAARNREATELARAAMKDGGEDELCEGEYRDYYSL